MAYSGVHVFGDSLVDAGNALKLAQWYGNLTASDLPDGAPTADKGYYAGRFTNGYTFADLIANKTVGAVTKPIFPFGFEYNGVPISPWTGDPSGNNLNFAYGGAQIRQGEEVVPDLDGQTDTFKDAVDNRPDPNALYIFTMGGNDVRTLAPSGSDPADAATAEAALRECAQQLIHEISQLIALGARHILITGIPDVGLIPKYDDEPGQPGYGGLEGEEIARSEAATRYSQLLDELIQNEVLPALINALVARGVSRADAEQMIKYVQIMDHHDALGGVTSSGALSAVLPTLEYLNNLPAGELSANPFAHQEVIFFDRIHPNAQTHALIGAYMQADITNSAWVENMPLLGAHVDYASVGTIGATGEVDTVSIAMIAGSTYTFQLLGVSTLTPYVLGQLGIGSLPTGPILGDPSLRLLSGSVVVKADDDSGAGFDSSLVYDVTTADTYSLQMLGVGALTGSYVLTATVAGAAMGDNSYTVSSSSTLVIEAQGGGTDTVNASVSYALGAGSEIELLQTTNARGKGGINLTGNDFGQKIVGNAGANVLEGKGGSDELWGGAGNDRFVLSNAAVQKQDGSQVDRIMDYAKGDVVDITQVLSVAAGTNVISLGYLRVTTSGLIQVDLDGGGNNWVTLSTINGTAAVSVRYLSGGSTTTVSVARVSAPASMAVAAAGLMAMPLAAEPNDGQAEGLSTSSGALAGPAAVAQGDSESLSAAVVAKAIEPMIGDNAELSTSQMPARHAQIVEQRPEPVDQLSVEPLSALLSGTDPSAQAQASVPLAAHGVMMPAAEMLLAIDADAGGQPKSTGEVGRVLADALGGDGAEPQAFDALLDALPGQGRGLEMKLAEGVTDDPAFAAFHSPNLAFATETMAVQQDAAPNV